MGMLCLVVVGCVCECICRMCAVVGNGGGCVIDLFLLCLGVLVVRISRGFLDVQYD